MLAARAVAGLFARRGGQAPQGHRQEGRGAPQGRGRQVHQEGGRERDAEEEGRGAVGAHPAVRPLRLQQVAFGRLRAPRVPHGVDEGAPPGGVPRGHAHGQLGQLGRRRQVREHLPGDEDPRAAAGRQRVGPFVHAGRAGDPVRPRSREGRRGRRRRLRPRGARGRRPVQVPDGFLLARRPPPEQPAGHRGARSSRAASTPSGRAARRFSTGSTMRSTWRPTRARPRRRIRALLFDVPKETQIEDQFPDKPEWSVDEKIRYEKETLGFYITGHPLARFEDEIRMFGDVTCETLRERLDAQVKLVGPRRGGQEDPDQEGPERGEDDGEGRRRGPHGLRAGDRLREPSRARRVVARAGPARARHGNGAPRPWRPAARRTIRPKTSPPACRSRSSRARSSSSRA